MENDSNYTPLGEDFIVQVAEPINAQGVGFFGSKKMIYFIVGAFALVSILIITISLLLRIRDNAAQVKGTNSDTLSRVGSDIEKSDSLDIVGKPTKTPTERIQPTRPPTRSPTVTPTKTPTPLVTVTTVPTATHTPTNTPIPPLLPTATHTPTPTHTPTNTPTITNTPAATSTPTATQTPTETSTVTPTPTNP